MLLTYIADSRKSTWLKAMLAWPNTPNQPPERNRSERSLQTRHKKAGEVS